VNTFELWVAHELAVFMLESARVAGLIIAAPLAWMHLPLRVRGLLVLLLAFFIHGPAVAADMREESTLMLGLALGTEFAVGVSLGFVARLVLAVAEIAGDSIAPIMGLGAAQMFDPSLGGQATVLTKLLRYFGSLVALSCGLHHLLLAALFQSFRAIPAGSLVNPIALTPSIVMMVSEMIAAGVKLALPIVAILFISQVALAFVARAAPAMQIFSIGFGVTLGVGGLLFVLFASDILLEFELLEGWAENWLSRLIQTLAEQLP